jgi:serine/threonine protein kinase
MDARTEIPRQLGPYSLCELVGQGPLCSVWRAERQPEGAELAVKVLDPLWAANPVWTRRFEQEARLAHSLQHPHIVRVCEVVMPPESPLPLLAMDLLRGGSAGQFRGAPASEFATIRRILVEICQALQYVHGRRLVHCDVKASNVLLDDRQHSYLADFGMTASPEELADAGSRGGTIQYISPEQFASLTDGAAATQPVDARSDLYSLGVLMYELFTGRAPFTAGNRFSLIYQRMNTDPQRPSAVRPELPPQLDDVILKALARQPAARFQTAAELQTALAELKL